MSKMRGMSVWVVMLVAGCVEGRDPEVLDGPIDDREGQPCDAVVDDSEDCDFEGGDTRFCVPNGGSGGEDAWGVCVAEPECTPGDRGSCLELGTRECEIDGAGVPSWGECVEGTPLVVIPPGERIELTASAAASFDLGAACLSSDWPSAATPWLARDVDRSGSIDGGHELFGSATRMADGSRVRNGFLALAELDANRDGRIDADDPAYAELILWSDHDGDRHSTHAEHTSLAAAGIVAIPLAYESAASCDARGNCAIERATATMRGQAQGAEVVDIHLACQ